VPSVRIENRVKVSVIKALCDICKVKKDLVNRRKKLNDGRPSEILVYDMIVINLTAEVK
jgi:hypothetical protein